MRSSSEPLFANDEKKDLEKLQVDLNRIARDAMDALRHSDEMSAEMLPHVGHKSNEAAVRSTFKHYRKQMDAAIAAHIKKYPDSK